MIIFYVILLWCQVYGGGFSMKFIKFNVLILDRVNALLMIFFIFGPITIDGLIHLPSTCYSDSIGKPEIKNESSSLNENSDVSKSENNGKGVYHNSSADSDIGSSKTIDNSKDKDEYVYDEDEDGYDSEEDKLDQMEYTLQDLRDEEKALKEDLEKLAIDFNTRQEEDFSSIVSQMSDTNPLKRNRSVDSDDDEQRFFKKACNKTTVSDTYREDIDSVKSKEELLVKTQKAIMDLEKKIENM
jgi:hypothetical protein